MKLIKKNICFCFLLVLSTNLFAQTIEGRVTDDKQTPIESVTVVMQTLDSTFVDAAITDLDGVFTFKTNEGKYRLIFQHLLYKSLIKEYEGASIGIVTMQEQDYALDEVVIKGERPLVKAENGSLTYDVAAMAEKSTIGNAYESITHLPGVMEQNEGLSLVGAGDVIVILNGKPSSMTNEQLVNLLKNTGQQHSSVAGLTKDAPQSVVFQTEMY